MSRSPAERRLEFEYVSIWKYCQDALSGAIWREFVRPLGEMGLIKIIASEPDCGYRAKDVEQVQVKKVGA